MNLLTLHLQTCCPAKNIFRAYRLWAGKDLLGDWMVRVTYGRIGAKGTNKTYIFHSKEEALHKIALILKKRSSAYKRLGCSYTLVDYQAGLLHEIFTHICRRFPMLIALHHS